MNSRLPIIALLSAFICVLPASASDPEQEILEAATKALRTGKYDRVKNMPADLAETMDTSLGLHDFVDPQVGDPKLVGEQA